MAAIISADGGGMAKIMAASGGNLRGKPGSEKAANQLA